MKKSTGGRSFLCTDSRKGQSIVELAISVPLLILLIMGVTELANFIHTSNRLTTAVREGARVAPETTVISTAPAAAQSRVRRALTESGIPWDRADVSVPTPVFTGQSIPTGPASEPMCFSMFGSSYCYSLQPMTYYTYMRVDATCDSTPFWGNTFGFGTIPLSATAFGYVSETDYYSIDFTVGK